MLRHELQLSLAAPAVDHDREVGCRPIPALVIAGATSAYRGWFRAFATCANGNRNLPPHPLPNEQKLWTT